MNIHLLLTFVVHFEVFHRVRLFIDSLVLWPRQRIEYMGLKKSKWNMCEPTVTDPSGISNFTIPYRSKH